MRVGVGLVPPKIAGRASKEKEEGGTEDSP